MDLTLRGGYWVKFCMELIAVMSHDNYYSQFCHPCGLENREYGRENPLR
jgi:hypothetical protein